MIHLFALLSLLLCGVCYTGFQNSSHFRNTGSRRSLLLLVFGGALLLRLLLAYTTHGFSNDIACFAAWADRIFTLGPGQFYSAEMFTDYPPGFMYVLYLIGALRSLLQIPYYSDLHILLLKLPAILCDIACGFLLYREAVKQTAFFRSAGNLCCLCVSVPAGGHSEFFLLGTGGFRIHADDHPYVPVPHEGKPASCLCCLRTGCPVKATDADLHAGAAGRDLGSCILT